MSDPTYQPPKTDPTLKGEKSKEEPKHVVSTKKILYLTFIPSVVLLVGVLASRNNIDLFMMTVLAATVLAFIISIFSAIEFSKGKESTSVTVLGYWVLFVIVHAILLFIALFIGCGIASVSS